MQSIIEVKAFSINRILKSKKVNIDQSKWLEFNLKENRINAVEVIASLKDLKIPALIVYIRTCNIKDVLLTIRLTIRMSFKTNLLPYILHYGINKYDL